jgi:hypothetical protein
VKTAVDNLGLHDALSFATLRPGHMNFRYGRAASRGFGRGQREIEEPR